MAGACRRDPKLTPPARGRELRGVDVHGVTGEGRERLHLDNGVDLGLAGLHQRVRGNGDGDDGEARPCHRRCPTGLAHRTVLFGFR